MNNSYNIVKRINFQFAQRTYAIGIRQLTIGKQKLVLK